MLICSFFITVCFSPGKRIKLSNGTESPLPSPSAVPPDGSLFGTPSCSSTPSTAAVTPLKALPEMRDKAAVKLTISAGKQNGTGLLPRSVQLNGKRPPSPDEPNKLSKPLTR